MDQEKNTGNGASMTPVIGGLVLIIVLAAIGWYALKGKEAVAPESLPVVKTAVVPQPDTATEALKVQGTSDAVPDIKADLKATDLNSLNDIQRI